MHMLHTAWCPPAAAPADDLTEHPAEPQGVTDSEGGGGAVGVAARPQDSHEVDADYGRREVHGDGLYVDEDLRRKELDHGQP
eukprot:scaffold124955_cov48-Phaeocystis_antarctica.AAC.2